MKSSIFSTVFLLIHFSIFSLNIQPKFASLTANGPALKFSVKADKNDNYEISVSSNIKLLNDSAVVHPDAFNIKDSKAWIAVKNTRNEKSDTCLISIVPWIANLSELKITKKIDERFAILGKADDTLMVVYKNKLYKTGSDIYNMKFLSNFEVKSSDYYWAYLKTPAGSFIRITNDIYYSKDEKNWVLDYTTKGRGIRNSFAFTYDSTTQITRVFAHDYSVTGQDTFPHSVYRKTISKYNKDSKWEKIFTLSSKDQWAVNQSLFPACRHIHALVVDPFTGHIWIATGDLDQHSQLFYSDDNGDSWKQVGMGSQEWRVLSLWFTKDYVYWAMDTSVPSQRIFRVNRDIFNKNGFWPTMTPKLISGKLKNNLLYILASASSDNYYLKLNKKVGDIVRGNNNILINDSNAYIALNDPDYDYRETVAKLTNNALWGYTTAFDQRGEPIILLSANGEGQAIDDRPRVFGIKEFSDGSVEVQELLSSNLAISKYSQFYPYEQDALGNMYFQTNDFNTYHYQGLIQTQLIWNDNYSFEPGQLDSVVEEDRNKLTLLIKNCAADSLIWQKSPSTKIKWSNLTNKRDKSDKLFVERDSTDLYLYRALMFKEGFSPTPSNFLRIDKKEIKDSLKNKSSSDSFSYKLETNGTQKRLIINGKDGIAESIKIIIYDYSGKAIFSEDHNFSIIGTYGVDLQNISKGLYILHIVGTTKYLTEKILL